VRLRTSTLYPLIMVQKGLFWGVDRQLVSRMKRPRGGSLFLLLKPDELLARLATLVPPPRTHSVRYHGIFAPTSKARARVVPAPPEAPDPSPPSSRPKAIPGTRTYRLPWADLLKMVFAADDTVARRILLHLRLDSRGPTVAGAQAPPDFSEPGPSYDGAVHADRILPALVGEARPCPGIGRLPPSWATIPVRITLDQASSFRNCGHPTRKAA
jgi:hypothetical protein